jgi:hypothetical protein
MSHNNTPHLSFNSLALKNAVENHFTAKPPRAQRTYRKINFHPFDGDIDPLDFDSVLCFPWRLCAFAVEFFIPTAVFRLS